MRKPVIFGMSVLMAFCSLAMAANRSVPSTYPTIQAAIDAAAPGDSVVIAPGTYSGAGNRDISFKGKAITVRSIAGPATCIIDCGGLGRGFLFETNETNTSVLQGLTIKNGKAVYGGAIECYVASSPTIRDCIITNNTADYGGGIDCYQSSPAIFNCVMQNNAAHNSYNSGQGGGIALDASSPSVINCLFQGNTTDQYGIAIDCFNASKPVITNCTFVQNQSANSLAAAVCADALSALAKVVNSVLWDNSKDISGVLVEYSCVKDGTTGTGVIKTNPLFRTGPKGNFYFSQIAAGQLIDSPCLNTGDPASNLTTLGINTMSTRTDNVADSGQADMGYHYPGGAAPVQVPLTIQMIPIGGIKPATILPVEGTAPYAQFSDVTIEVTPNLGYKVKKWTGTNDDASTDKKNVVTVITAKTVTVQFQTHPTFTLTTQIAVGQGTLLPITGLYNSGDTVTLTATPADGFRVGAWTGTVNDEQAFGKTTATVLVDKNKTVTVAFVSATISRLDVRVIGGHGTVTPRRGDFLVGTKVNLEARPDLDYRIKQWTGTDNDMSKLTTNTVTLAYDSIVTVTFEKAPRFWLQTEVYSSDGQIHGTLTPPSGWNELNPDQSPQVINLTATPNVGWEVEKWSFDNVIDETTPGVPNTALTNTVTMDNDHRVVVIFREIDPNPWVANEIRINNNPAPKYTTIQEAMDAAAPGDEVVVGKGTFSGVGNINLVFTGGKAITVRSLAGPADTIIDCQGAGRGFFFRNNESAQSIVRGFTIRNGVAPTGEDVPGSGRGGGIYMVGDCEATVENCIFENCQAEDVGGGIAFAGADTIDAVEPTGDPNDADYVPGVPGVANDEDVIPKARLANCVFQNCVSTGNGGAIFAEEAAPTIVSCQIIGCIANAGAGIYSLGIADQEDHPAIINCLMTQNLSRDGNGDITANGVITAENSSPTIQLCTLALNMGSGGIFAITDTSNPKIDHCILDGNGDEVNGCSATYSCITDMGFDSVGPGNVYDIPQFIAGPSGNFYLGQEMGNQLAPQWSLCVDAGLFVFGQLRIQYNMTDPMTTAVTEVDDVGRMDMGYHYPKTPLTEIPTKYKFKLFPSENGSVWYRIQDNAGRVLMEEGTVLADSETVVRYLPNWTVVDLKAMPVTGYRVAAWFGTDNDLVVTRKNMATLFEDREVRVTFEDRSLYPTRVLVVPDIYLTIEQAVETAGDGDIVVVSPGIHYIVNPAGIDFGGKQIKLISIDPANPAIVAATIIDCMGTGQIPKRAFYFHNGEDRETLVAGFTIRKGWYNGGVGILAPGYIWPGAIPPNLEIPVSSGASGGNLIGDGFGGAVLCEDESSPTFQYCVFSQNTITGGQGRNGITPLIPHIDSDGNGHSRPGGHGGNGTGNGHGGAIACLTGSSPLLSYCSFIDNNARGGCGGDGGNAGPLSQIDPGNESRGGDGGNGVGIGRGGALYADGSSEPVVVECEFTGNIATEGLKGFGGAMTNGDEWGDDWVASDGIDGLVQSFGGTIFDDFFQPFGGTIAGGAVYFAAGAIMDIPNGMLLPGGKLNFSNCRFIGNKAFRTSVSLNWINRDFPPSQESYIGTLAGGIYVGMGNEVDVQDCVFEGNLGGAMYFEGTNFLSSFWSFGPYLFQLQRCAFRENGSAIPVVTGTLLPNQVPLYSNGPAGALSIGSGIPSATITDCEFAENFTYGSGGAVYAYSDATFERCRFGGNRADGLGGAVFSDSRNLLAGNPIPVLTFNQSDFYENEAVEGGAFYLYVTQANLNGCNIFNNLSENGGGLFLGYTWVNLAGGIVAGNSAASFDALGGGIACVDTMLNLSDCILQANRVEGTEAYGGALGIYASDLQTRQKVKNCLFEGNAATNGGGAVSVRISSVPTFSNCTFANNQALLGAAVYTDWTSKPTLANSIFSGNSPQAIYEQPIAYNAMPGGDSVVNFSLFYNNSVDLYDGQTNQGYTGAAAINAIGSNHDNLDGDPLFAAGILGAFYLNPTSPAVDRGDTTAELAGLAARTTRIDNVFDSGVVDLGYHYVGMAGVPMVTLSVSVIGGHGQVTPSTGTYYQGQTVILTATPDFGYRVNQWGGGTINDLSGSLVNVVVLDSSKQVTIQFEQPRVLIVESAGSYTDIQRAIDDAKDGDTVLIQPGRYIAVQPFDFLLFHGKTIRLSGMNPNNPQSVNDTVFFDYDFSFVGVGKESVIEGLTIEAGTFGLNRSDITLRNIRFLNCAWHGGSPIPGDTDGYNGGSVYGGAIDIHVSNPKLFNCRFENCSVTGGNGLDGANGSDPDHPNGYDGGWAGKAYGGAVYIGYASKPMFVNCEFLNCFARGGNAGNGGNADDASKNYGGRGGNWVFAKTFEDQYMYWWDGWEWGTRYSSYHDATSVALGSIPAISFNYPWERFAKWFGLEQYTDWNDWIGSFRYDPFDPAYDEYWRYSGYGGAVYCEYDSQPTFVDCRFENNHTYGGLSGIGGNGVYHDLVPDRNLNIGNGGGAIFATRGSKVTMLNCLIRGNQADPTTINQSDDPYVSFGGGIAYTTESVIKAIGCTFDNNQAAIGGAIYWNESDLDIADCNLVSNSAYQGAALYSAYSTGLIRGASVTNNLAMYNPNAIINPLPGQPSLIPDLPNIITTGYGGGYFALSTPAIIEDSVFEQNRASASGGGLYVVGSDQDIFAAPTLNNCLIVHNVAVYEGGGLAGAWYAEPSLLNCTVADNTITDPEGQGGGVYIGYSSNGTITNSIVWDNVARNGSQIAVSSGGKYTEMPSSMEVRYSDILFYEDPSQFLEPDTTVKAIRPGFNAYSLPANDNLSSEPAFIGFPIDFYGILYDSLYVNSNGNVTFGMPLFNYTPLGLTTNIGTAIVAPFFADVDTTAAGSDVVTWGYGAGSVGGHDAFGVNWVNVGYSAAHGDKFNSFQMVIIDRSDRNPGDFDMEFNYGRILWETGDSSMGIDGFGGDSARVGYSNGTGVAGTFFEMDGSGVNGYFLDSSSTGLIHNRRNSQVLGRYVFRVINGNPEIPGTAMFVEKGSVLQGWDAQKLTWLEDLHNINADPLFLGGYYLSQVASGQRKDSPAINVGSDKASVLGLVENHTTRTDGVGEQPDSIVDMGYHYLEAAPRVKLILKIIGDGWGTVAYEPITGLYDPTTDTYQFPVGTIVKLTATPKPGYRVRRWVGTDDKRTYRWHDNTAEVTMDQTRVVELEFELDIVRTLTVPEVYVTIEDALAVASGGDTIVLAPGVHFTTSPEGMDFAGRNIRLISTNPNDPQTVATTIIDCQGAHLNPKRAFYFHNGETSESLISGLTIINALSIGDVGQNGILILEEIWPGLPPNMIPRANGNQDARGFGYGGAILCDEGSSPTITNCVFRNCSIVGAWGGDGANGGTWLPGGPHSQSGGHGGIAAGNGFGGAIACLRGSIPVIRDCTFDKNFACGAIGGKGGDAGPSGGGHEGDGGDGGDALGYGQGGAIYCDGKSDPVIQDCVFTNNSVAGSIPGQGGLKAEGSSWGGTPPWVAANGLSGLGNNYGRVSGGALGFGMDSNVRVIHCVFSGNKAYEQQNVANYAYRQDLNIVESYLNTRGGAIFSDPNSMVLLEDLQFQDNLGGAVYLSENSDILVKNCKFTGNGCPANTSTFQSYSGYGLTGLLSNINTLAAVDSPSGALYIGPKARKVRVENAEFLRNFTFGDGGAVTCRSDAEFVKCRFAGNSADRFGGGFYFYDPTRDPNDPMIEIDFDACSFMDNTAIHGGGLWLREVKVNLKDTFLFTNTAETAGAILLADGDITMDGGIVRGNLSTADDTHGGAILFASASGTLRNLVFEDNAVTGENSYGGAVSFYGSDARDIQRIENCLLTGNRATAGGGAIACRIFMEAQIRNCTFIGNDGGLFGGAVYCDWSSYPKITDSIFSANVPEAIYEEQIGGDSQIRYSLFDANPRDLFDAETGLGYTGAAALNALGTNANNRDGDPKFVAGSLGANYLAVGSPAVDGGSMTATAAGLNLRTTRVDNINDLGTVDIGYHYANAIGMAKYQLTASVEGGHGLVSPVTGSYYAGTPVTLTAVPDNGYRVDRWGGGTANDQSRELTNLVIMDSDKKVTVRFYQPRILLVGSGTEFTSIQHAIQAAQDGDIILIKPGQYVPAYPFGVINFQGKDITLSGMNPDDPASVGATVLNGYSFNIYNVGPRSVIEGLTIHGGSMAMINSRLTIRNCQFSNTNWHGGNGVSIPGNDGSNGGSVMGGVLKIFHSSPVIQNCRFEGLSVTGGDGAQGSDSTDSHVSGFDGGWAGRAYGGAVYMALGSNPSFESCQFINCFARGGNGGNGGNGDTPNGGYGGRGGSWIWPDFIEQSAFYWWDGWAWGDRDLAYVSAWTSLLYPWEQWSYWYNLSEFRDWNDWMIHRQNDRYENAYEEYWRYSGYGGAVYCDFNSKASFKTCHFENNHSYGGLSGIGGNGVNGTPWPNRNLNIENGGGALFATRGSKVDLVECLFRNNSAESSTLGNATPPVDTYDDFYVSFGGGVAATQESLVRMSKCTFASNQAAIGGGLYWGQAEVEVADCNFIANSAYHGGGLYSADGSGSIVGLKATMNLAAVDPAILASQTDPDAQPGVTPIILPNLPHTITFGEGGAYFCLASDVEVRDSVFTKNRAAGSGGAVFFIGSDPDVTVSSILHNSLLSDNIAGRDGGGVSVDWYGRVKISNTTLSENTVTGSVGDGAGFGGGLYVSYGSDVDILNSIIWNNVAVEGAQLAVGSGNEFGPRPSTVRVHYTDIGPQFDPNAILGLTDSGSIIPPSPRGNGNTAVVTDMANLQQQLTGGGMAKVIVLLQQPIELRKTLDWNNPFTVQAYRAEVEGRITAALSALPAGEFVLKYRYENVAAFSGSVTQAGLDQLINSRMVASIEPVREVQPMLRQAIPLGNALQARQEYDGTGISIAIVDSGVDYRHPMLGGGGFPNAKVIGGYDVGDNDNNPMPSTEAHGTNCAGIAAGDLGEVGDYIGGVAPGARLYALKLTGDNGSWANDAGLLAWDWCVTHQNDDPANPIMVMSNSWGRPAAAFADRAAADAYAPTYTQMAALAVERGITIMAAAGNSGYQGQIIWPSAMSNVISVGAVYDTTDQVTDYSCTAEILDILAPADPVYSTDIVGAGGYDPGDYYPYFNGTSSACPFAAGCVADIQNAARIYLGRYLLPEEVRRLLVRTGDPVTDTKIAITRPRVNLGMAIAGIMPPKPIFVEPGAVLVGWDDATQKWSPDTYNLMDDPIFVSEYFLSEIAAGQLHNSPCLNAGSGQASVFGLDKYTTRSDGGLDAGRVNLGYHRLPFEPSDVLLRTAVYASGLDSLYGYHPTITPFDPKGIVTQQYTQLDLKIQPEPPVGYEVLWTGTDNDRIVTTRNVVTVDRNKSVTAEFVKVSFALETRVTVDPELLPGFTAHITPSSGLIKPLTRVKLTVTPPPAGFQVRWRGTDKDGGIDPINYVTMKRDTVVEAWYEKVQVKYYAILCGINDVGGGYPGLQYAQADASQVYGKLLQMPEWKAENIHILLGRDATLDRMRLAVLDLRQRMDPDDVFVFYFAGHGFASPDALPIDEIDGFDENLFLAGQEALSDDQVAKWIASLPTHKYAVFLDTGFRAGNGQQSFTPRGLGINIPKPGDDFGIDLIPHQTVLKDGTAYMADPNGLGVVVTAAQGDQMAWEYPELGHGLFTYFFLKAIDGWADQAGNKNGRTSGEECFTSVSQSLAAWLKDWDEIGALPLDFKQQPGVYDATTAMEIEVASSPTQGAEPRTFYVPDSADGIQQIMDMARDGDLIVLSANTYRGGLIVDKNVTITSANPDDPEVVAATIIDCSNSVNRGIYFTGNAGPGAVLNGITLQNGAWTAFAPDAGTYDGRSIGGGGILVGYQSSPTIKNCIIRGFHLTGGNAVVGPGPDGDDGGFAFGAGIYCASESAPTIINTTITDCHVVGGNATGGVSASAGNPTATPPVPASGVSGRGGWGGGARGGGVYIAPLSNAVLSNCTISNCSATGGNGGNGGNFAQINGVDVPGGYGGLWSDSSYAPWQAWGYVGDYRYYAGSGAGVYCEIQSEPKFVECLIQGNQTRGGMSGQGGTMPAGQDRRQPVTAYELPSYGGGVFCGEKVKAEFVKCRLFNNVAPKPTTSFTLNSSLGHGGGIAFERSASIVFDACSFQRNDAAVGAGMYYLDDAPVIADCNFIANTAYEGGGLFADGGAGTIDNTEFIANLAGAITNAGGTGGVTVSSDILGQGGAIASVSGATQVKNSRFQRNFASTSGGGLFFSGAVEGAGNPSMTNCLVTNNVAGRDGGGVSSNWYSLLTMSNCTLTGNNASGIFGQTPDDGYGGALYCGYGSEVSVDYSIVWSNTAANGRNLVVGTGFEYDPRPGKMTVSHTFMSDGWSETFALVEDGCTLDKEDRGNLDSNVSNPLFVSGRFGAYYLSQLAAGQNQQSPCVDPVGITTLASALGMDKFTTRNDGGLDIFDTGRVDLGYHYPMIRGVAECRACDIGLDYASTIANVGRDGRINIADLAVISQEWLRPLDQPCSAPGWCNGADINRNGRVELNDLLRFVNCWTDRDEVVPVPSQSEWGSRHEGQPGAIVLVPGVPTAVPGTLDQIIMTAKPSFDNWGWDLAYRFDGKVTSGTATVTSPWLYFPQGVDPTWTATGLAPETSYTFTVRVAEIRVPGTLQQAGYTVNPNGGTTIKASDVNPNAPLYSLWTTPSISASDTTGHETDAPILPEVAWLTVPYQPLAIAVSMEAAAATDVSPPLSYLFRRYATPNAATFTEFPAQTARTFVDTTVVVGQSYTYTFVVKDRHGNTSVEAPRVTVAVTAAPLDFNPPLPDPPTWQIAPVRLPINGQYWDFMQIAVAVDPEGTVVEYQIHEIETGLDTVWRAAAPVNIGPDGQEYPGNAFWIPAGGHFNNRSYQCRVRDSSPNRNMTTYSTPPYIPRQ